MQLSTSTLAPAALLGFAAGARSMSAPAALARHLADTPAAPTAPPAGWLAHPAAARVLVMLAAGELLGDKLPQTPDRVDPAPLAGRLAAGALVGAVAAQLAGRSRLTGAAVGTLAALLGTELTYHARRLLGERLGVPDRLIAVVEDAAVLATVRRAAAAT